MNTARKQIIETLKKFSTTNKQEQEDVQTIIELVNKYDNIFDRECTQAHLTGSALVFNPKNKTVLLHNHKKLNKWLQFGGHADGETNIPEVAMKEAQEESGLKDLAFFNPQNNAVIKPVDIEVQTIPENKGVSQHLHLDLRYLITTDATQVPTPEEHESQELQFFTFTELNRISDKIDPALHRLIEKAQQQL